MRVKTRYFGEIELDDDKVLCFENGLVGFENLKEFAIMYDIEDDEETHISWLQSLEDETIAFTVINPFHIMPEYKPIVEDELLNNIGNNEEDWIVFTTIRIPSDTTKISTNLKAPIIINTKTKKGCQIIAENADYEINFSLYYIIEKMNKQRVGE